MDAYELMMKRRSVRNFTGQPIPDVMGRMNSELIASFMRY